MREEAETSTTAARAEHAAAVGDGPSAGTQDRDDAKLVTMRLKGC